MNHIDLTKPQLIAQILRRYEERGHAMRCLDKRGRIAWKSSPQFLTMLADAERDAQDELEDFRSGSGERVEIASNYSLI